MRWKIGFTAALTLGLGLLAGAQAGGEKEKPGHGDADGHVLARPDDLKWVQGPPSLPAGAKVAILVGDPSKAAPFVLRAKMPDGYKVPAHWHPSAENVTVLKGIFHIGRGDDFKKDKTEALPAGSFMHMPKKMPHFAWVEGETIIQVHGVGPFEVNYVNAEDDPRKK